MLVERNHCHRKPYDVCYLRLTIRYNVCVRYDFFESGHRNRIRARSADILQRRKWKRFNYHSKRRCMHFNLWARCLFSTETPITELIIQCKCLDMHSLIIHALNLFQGTNTRLEIKFKKKRGLYREECGKSLCDLWRTLGHSINIMCLCSLFRLLHWQGFIFIYITWNLHSNLTFCPVVLCRMSLQISIQVDYVWCEERECVILVSVVILSHRRRVVPEYKYNTHRSIDYTHAHALIQQAPGRT